MNLDNARIAVIGLGYVGLPLAVEFGKLRPVLGYDINSARIRELQGQRDSTLEVSAKELQAASQLSFSSDAEDLKSCQVFIVTVPTPVDRANRPDLTPLIKASETVGRVMPKGAVVIYESTVYPGATEEVCVPVLEKFSGKKFNVDFFLRLQPGADQPRRQGTPAAHDPQDHERQHAGGSGEHRRPLRTNHHCRYSQGRQHEDCRSGQGHRKRAARREYRVDERTKPDLS